MVYGGKPLFGVDRAILDGTRAVWTHISLRHVLRLPKESTASIGRHLGMQEEQVKMYLGKLENAGYIRYPANSEGSYEVLVPMV